jgi:hypothetical protein
MGNIIDIAFFGLLGLIAVINFFAGFHRGALDNIFTIIKIAGLVFLTGVIGNAVKGIDAIASMLAMIADPINGLLKGVGDTVANVVLMIVVGLVVLIVLSIVLAIIKHFIRKPFLKENDPGPVRVWIDRILGVIVSVAIYGVILLAVVAVVGAFLPDLTAGSFVASIIADFLAI